MIVLETKRMFLRLMVEQDVDNLLQIFSDHVAMTYYPSTKSKDETLKWIEWTLNNYAKHGIGLWIAELKENRQFVGQCGLIPQLIEEALEIEVGYLFLRSHWGLGLASECAIACKDYGFNTLGYEHLVSQIDKRNMASIRVAEKNGMKLEKEIIKNDRSLYIYGVHNKAMEKKKSQAQ